MHQREVCLPRDPWTCIFPEDEYSSYWKSPSWMIVFRKAICLCDGLILATIQHYSRLSWKLLILQEARFKIACVQAIDVLDQAGARVRLQQVDGLRAARDLKVQLNAIDKELISAKWKNNAELAKNVCTIYSCGPQINVHMHHASVMLLITFEP